MKRVLLGFLMVLSVVLIGCEDRNYVPDFRFADFSILEKGMSFEYAKSILGEPNAVANHENIGFANFMGFDNFMIEDDIFALWEIETSSAFLPTLLSANFSKNEINTINISPRPSNSINQLTFENSGNQFTEFSAFEAFGMPHDIWIFENGETRATWLIWTNNYRTRIVVDIVFLDGISINIKVGR